MAKAKFIEKINILGPWVHGYFDLGDGIIIKDSDILQQRRLRCYRDYFIDILKRHYGKGNLNDKTICDIGCNTGYFLFELYKEFGFKLATGLEPRATNRAKARFIAKHFNLLPTRYQIKDFDILNPGRSLPTSDIVIFPSVLHHIDNHFLALRNLYKMTNDVLIIDTHVLPDEFNTDEVKKKLELKDALYKAIDNSNFGVIGYKLEDSKLDGSTIYPGVVGIPTIKALEMMLRHVGFSEIEVYRDWRQLKKEVYYGGQHRDFHSAILVAKKSARASRPQSEYDRIARDEQYKEFESLIPEKLIEPCYQFITENRAFDSLPLEAQLICDSQVRQPKENAENQKRYLKKFSSEPYFSVLETIKYAPDHKIRFEYAKTCFIGNKVLEAKRILEDLCKIVNLDWRVVYKTYHLLALIALKEGKNKKATKYNRYALRTFPSYYPALDLRSSKLKES